MSKVALFIKAQAKPGKRDEIRKLWESHLKQKAVDEGAIEFYFYCYSNEDEDTILMFEYYSDPEVLQKAAASDWFARYMEEATPLMAGPADVSTGNPVWTKGATL